METVKPPQRAAVLWGFNGLPRAALSGVVVDGERKYPPVRVEEPGGQPASAGNPSLFVRC